MKYLAETIVDYIIEKAKQEKGTLKYILPSYPARLLWELGTKLEETTARNISPKIGFRYGIAYRLGRMWQESSDQDEVERFQAIDNKGWYNRGNNLTSLRHEIRKPDDDVLLILLAGFEDIDDQAGLLDFFHMDQPSIWAICLNKSFRPWVEASVRNWINIEDNKTYIEACAQVFGVLYENGLADLLGISNFLETMNLSGISNGIELYSMVLEDLSAFKLPRMSGLGRRNTKKDFRRYLAPAQEFFNYTMFINSTERDKMINRINMILNDEEKPEADEIELGSFKDIDKLLAAVLDYIKNRSDEARKSLLQADFIFIYDKIIGYKAKKEGGTSPPVKPKKIYGTPPEVFLRALWLTLGDRKKSKKPIGAFMMESLNTISVGSVLFRHDFNPGGEDDEHQEAKDFLHKVLDGIDQYLSNNIRIKRDEQEEINLISKLSPEKNIDISYLKNKTAEPMLKFEITLIEDDKQSFKREFLWVLPADHPSRLLANLYDWAREYYKNGGNALPVFRVPYIAEVFMAREEEECHRLVNTAIQHGERTVADLLGAPGIGTADKVLPSLHDLTIKYQNFLSDFDNRGFFSAMIESFNDVRKAYLNVFESYLENSRSSIVGPLLLKAFLIIGIGNSSIEGWEWDDHLECGLITPLHPALLDMMRHQYSFLCESFCYYTREAMQEAGDKLFAEKHWDRVVDLAMIQWPIFGTLRGFDHVLDTNVLNYGYIHLVGQCSEPNSFLNTRLLMEYEEEDDDVADIELFRETRTSILIKQILSDYVKLYPYAGDGITVGVYCGGEIQPVIAGIDNFLKNWLQKRDEAYALRLIIFSDSKDDTAVMRWINAWKSRWQQAELSSSMKHYNQCYLSINYRVVVRQNREEQFIKLLHETEMDVMLFADFVSSAASIFESLGEGFDSIEDYRKFPILEKVSCRRTGGGQEYRRERILSNHRFPLGALHAELMARLKNRDMDAKRKHALISYSDFRPWKDIINEAHRHCGWVVCIDPSVDEQLLLIKATEGYQGREIVGFGTGVGPHGENNYTISTEQYSMVNIKKQIGNVTATLFGPMEEQAATKIGDKLVQEAAHIAGLSLVKATGPDRFVREFIANTMVRKLLIRDVTAFCDEIISLDAFLHWFNDPDDKRRPDLLRLKARIIKGCFSIEAQLIECKLAMQSEGYLEKARQQLENGLKHLVPRFRPREDNRPLGIDSEDKPDQRYWWMQLHRLIASKGETTMENYQRTLLALERLSEGYFSITWQAAVFALWTDLEGDTLTPSPEWNFNLDGQDIDISVATAEKEFIRKACIEDAGGVIFSSESKLRYSCPVCEVMLPQDDKEEGEVIEVVETGKEAVDSAAGKSTDIELPVVEKLPPEVAASDKEKTDDATEHVPERILLGKIVGPNRNIFWEYGHNDLPNRHILVFGASGTGKTYTIQALLCEMAKQNQNSLIVDYTNGFTTRQLDSLVVDKLKPKQHIIYNDPLPINPFRKQCEYVDDIPLEEKSFNTADRVTGVLSGVYNLGEQQKSVLYNAIREGIEQNGNEFSLQRLINKLEILQENGGPTANSVVTVINKIKPFVDMNPFGKEDQESWEKLFNNSVNRCNIIQLAGFSKDTQRLITEFSLIDLYRYYRANGHEGKPRLIVLDEIQNLDHRLESPLGQFLTEGRKFGISLILATQTLSNLEKDERDRLFQASHKLFFKPADTEIKSFANILSDATGEKVDEWISRLSNLKRGECYSLGHAINERTGKLEVNKCFKIKISSIAERF